jgi:predicted enzyme related to lactoylglutathione lyase
MGETPVSNRIVHFEIHVADPERAIKFYAAVFGWAFPKWMENPPYWGVMTAAEGSQEVGINGGLMKRRGGSPQEGAAVNAFVCTVQVDDYDSTHEKIVAAGGSIALPKQAIPGMAWQGYYKDTDGNIFGVHQPDPKAK